MKLFFAFAKLRSTLEYLFIQG